MRPTRPDNLKRYRPQLGRLESLAPLALFIMLGAAFAALAAAADARSLPLIAVGAVALSVITIAFSIFLLTADRRATRPPRHIPWHAHEWMHFEACFWSYVEGMSDTPG